MNTALPSSAILPAWVEGLKPASPNTEGEGEGERWPRCWAGIEPTFEELELPTQETFLVHMK